ncbi:patatin-like phospholipase family protein [Acidobacterium sp. S8]|uniref:patatin-like phospholipase family protein n=1 Tax=Acidobacterium sp. S8 TaxID=1641854 RepID=UPI00131A6DDF|nr:patatin-like phospholipase family protein [Acidobacterium sp. S8]
MMRLWKAVVSGFAIGSLLAVSTQAQSDGPPAHTRPKIGLVLNGGGALGLAHIGVLRWLEEHHIPVDMVAGTSMGGLVGGVYATGNSPAQVRQLVEGIDWDQMLSDGTPYRDLSYRRKEDAANYPMALQFGIKKGLVSQGGYKAGQQVQLLLDKIALPYSNVQNFNDLPIPFACVATDLVSGLPHVFHSGSLGMALRATMSLPGVFAPVRTKDAIYADGGLVDNLPVDVAKEMGADVTLAIYLETAPIKPTEQMSAVGVLGRGISVMIAANELRSMQQADVLVSIPLQDFTTLDYSKSNDLIQKGYDAAQSKATILEKLSVDDATWQQYLAQRAKRMRTLPIPQFVEVTGISPHDTEQIKKQLAPTLQKPIDSDELARQLTTFASDQRVSNLDYGLTTNLSGVPGLVVAGQPETFGRNILRPLIVVNGWDYKNVTLSVGARLTTLDLGRYGAEWRNDILLGSEYQLFSEYFRPLSSSRKWFVAPSFFGDNAPLNLYSSDGLIAEYRNRIVGGRGDAGYLFGRSAELRVGYEAGIQRLYPNVGDPTLYPRVDGRVGDTHVRFNFDHIDNPITPMSGFRLQARSEWWDAKPDSGEAFPLAELSMLGFKPLTPRSSVYLGAAGGSTLWQNPGGLPPFSLGGSFRLPAYNTNELLTNQYFVFQGGYVRKLGALSPLVGGKVLFFAGADISKAYYVENASHLPSDGSAGIIINTLLGPIVLGGAIGDAGHYKFYFEIGRAYF